MDTSFPRRSFLRSAAAVAASCSLPDWFVDELSGADPAIGPKGEKPNVALIGCGGMGTGDAVSASRFGTITAVCDVDEQRMSEARKKWPEAAAYADFRKLLERKDISVVVCGTVDHWHTLISIAAMRAGKDVYCEKPLTLTVDEGKQIVRVAREPAAKRFPIPTRLRTGPQRTNRQVEACRCLSSHGPARWSLRSGIRSQGIRLGSVARTDSQRRLRQRTKSCHLPILVGILGRDHDRLGRSSQ